MQFFWPCLLFAPFGFVNFLASNATPSINVPGSSVSESELVGGEVCRAAPKSLSLCQYCNGAGGPAPVTLAIHPMELLVPLAYQRGLEGDQLEVEELDPLCGQGW